MSYFLKISLKFKYKRTKPDMMSLGVGRYTVWVNLHSHQWVDWHFWQGALPYCSAK